MRPLARRPERAKGPSPFHPLPLFPLPEEKGRGGGELRGGDFIETLEA
jgi:hypothetical protein